MKSISSVLVLLAVSVASGDSPELVAQFSTATVTIEPDTNPERRLALPAIEFEFTVAMNCGDMHEASRVSISVADTRRSYDIGALEDRHKLSASLTVPAEQISPLATQGFCTLDDPASPKILILPGVLTSQVSLLCGDQSDGAMHFVSNALAIRLVCGSPGPGQPSFSTLK